VRTHYLVYPVLILIAYVSWYIRKALAKCLNTCTYTPNSLSESKTRSWCHNLSLYRNMLVQWFVCCLVGCSRISRESVGRATVPVTDPSELGTLLSQLWLEVSTETETHNQYADAFARWCLPIYPTTLQDTLLCCQVPTDTLRLPWLRFSCAFSSVVRQMPGYTSQRWGTDRTLPN